MSKKIRIAAVGDISLGDEYLRYGCGVRAQIEKHGATYIFKYIIPSLSHHDIIFGNLECVLSSHNFNRNKLSSYQMRGDPIAVEGLKKAGFNILSVANNHIMQHGHHAMIETCNLLWQHGIAYCGLEAAYNSNKSCNIVETKDVKVCFLAYNDRPQQFFLNQPIYKRFELNSVLNEVEFYRQQVDIIIISLHWGEEFVDFPSPEQRNIAHQLISGGVDVIFGHHPHVVQGVERYHNGLIFYSLGNFVFDLTWYPQSNQTIIASLDYDIQSKLFEYRIIPVKINNNFQPVLMEHNESERFLNYFNSISRKLLINSKFPSEISSIEYEKLVTKKNSLERKLSHTFWCKNILNYPLIIIIQYLFDIIARRFKSICCHIARKIKLLKRKQVRIPILMYHEIISERQGEINKQENYSPYFITRENFERQMRYLYENNYQVISLRDLIALKNNIRINNTTKKYVIITFDDGYLGNYINAYPIIQRYKFKATIFVIVNKIGFKNHLSWSQLKEMIPNGIDVQSHTLTHTYLELLPEGEIKKELEDSRKILEEKLNNSIQFISYPQGSYNKKIFDLTKKAGYIGSCTSDIGTFDISDNLHQIKRINIKNDYTMNEFKKIVNQNLIFYLKLTLLHNIKKYLKKVIGLKNYIIIWDKIFNYKTKLVVTK